ncbi:MAG: hypothetical protein LKF82_12655 [Acinetobacter populi]|jgi:hypothetical protein|uniref:hypothetical protein n=1 Tax=Acinetobacter populi TaxID=1582270 RepID=UPI0023527CD8|nr:hypothetical protein [Acinetobacter populi]MCH4248656.1 hypothetical protein [Acinetobacter populi]
MRIIVGYGVFLFSGMVLAEMSRLPDFFVVSEQQVTAEESNGFPDDLSQLELQKKQRYVGEDQPLEEHSFLQNDFFQNDHFRIYNKTQYNFEHATSKFSPTQMEQLTLSDLSISLGYGMEFRVSHNQSWGYEYLSAFPYDRGQSIRLFWRYRF